MTPEEGWALFDMRNHPDALFWSGGRPISTEEHLSWMRSVAEQPTEHVIVVHPKVGYGRLRAKWELSFFVQPKYRGQGAGKEILRGMTDCAGGRPLIARVNPGNGPSLGAFRAADWRIGGLYTVVDR